MFKIPVSIPDGVHVASLAGVSESPSEWGQKRTWDWLVEVKTADGSIEIVPFSQMTSVNNSSGAVSYKLLTALLGAPPLPGAEVQAPTGQRVLLTFGKNQKGYTSVLDAAPYVEPVKSAEGLPR